MKRFGWLSFSLALVLVGCSGGSSETSSSGGSTSGGSKKSIEVQAFKGGYGIDFYDSLAKEYGASHNLDIKVDGSPRVWETLQPRLAAGDAPDLMFPGWGMDHWALADDGQLMPLDEALDGMAADGKTKWRDNFDTAMLELGKRDGKQYVLPYYVSVNGWWFRPKMFKDNGWTPPKTYGELLTLGEKIKAKGIAPICFQGQYPDYMTRGMLLPWARQIGGKGVTEDIDSFKAGAWQNPAVVKSLEMIDELNKKGMFLKGTVALSHTESQMEFLLGKAAMIPCGTWLKAEMQASMPKDADMAFFLPPAPDGSGDKTAVMIKLEPWMVPAKAKNPQEGIDLFKFMTSPANAKKFVEQKDTLMAIKGSSDGAKISPELAVAADTLKNSTDVWAPRYIEESPELHTEVGNTLTAMLNGQLTPVQAAERMEKKAQEVAAKKKK